MISSDLFKTPIIVLSSRTLTGIKDLTLTLETLIRQTGIEPKNVVIFYDPSCCSSIKHLAKLFAFMTSEYCKDCNTREEVILDALLTIQLLFPEGNQVIVIESHVILSPDFLPFFGQMIPVLTNDVTLFAVNAWNENGFEATSSDANSVYRASSFLFPPRFAFMTKRLPWLTPTGRKRKQRKETVSNTDDSLSFEEQGYQYTLLSPEEVRLNDSKEVLVPDVSRISLLVTPDASDTESEGNDYDQNKRKSFLRHFLSHPRAISLQEETGITTETVANLSSSSNYENMIRWMVRQEKIIESCHDAVAFIQNTTRHPIKQKDNLYDHSLQDSK